MARACAGAAMRSTSAIFASGKSGGTGCPPSSGFEPPSPPGRLSSAAATATATSSSTMSARTARCVRRVLLTMDRDPRHRRGTRPSEVALQEPAEVVDLHVVAQQPDADAVLAARDGRDAEAAKLPVGLAEPALALALEDRVARLEAQHLAAPVGEREVEVARHALGAARQRRTPVARADARCERRQLHPRI